MSLLIKNAKIYVDRDRFEEALLINDEGYIEAVGPESELLSQVGETTKIYDALGRTIVPGFNDSHMHFLNAGIALDDVRLHDCRSIADVIRAGKEYIARRKPGKGAVIHGMGWNHDYFTDERRMLRREDLDKISTEYPIIFDRACGHIICCNSKAFELASVTAETKPNEGGEILVENGKLTGIVTENARAQVRKILSDRPVDEKVRLLERALKHAHECGITSIQTCDIRNADWSSSDAAYQKFSEKHKDIRINHQFSFMNPSDFRSFLESDRLKNGRGDAFHRYGNLKLFVDGSLGGRTALMREEYKDAPTVKGVATLTQQQLDELVKMADENGFGVVVHAIGDGAIERVLNSYDKVCDGSNPNRHGIIHVQITDKPLLERFKKNNILSLVQPIFLHYDSTIVEDRVGKDLASTSYAFKTMEDLGIHTSYGTDCPVEDMDTMNNIYCAVTRKRLDHPEKQGFHPEESVDVQTAVDDYTVESAYVTGEENFKGRLKKGFVADLAILSKDIFTIPLEEIKDVKVDATMVQGDFVYQR